MVEVEEVQVSRRRVLVPVVGERCAVSADKQLIWDQATEPVLLLIE